LHEQSELYAETVIYMPVSTKDDNYKENDKNIVIKIYTIKNRSQY